MNQSLYFILTLITVLGQCCFKSLPSKFGLNPGRSGQRSEWDFKKLKTLLNSLYAHVFLPCHFLASSGSGHNGKTSAAAIKVSSNIMATVSRGKDGGRELHQDGVLQNQTNSSLNEPNINKEPTTTDGFKASLKASTE